QAKTIVGSRVWGQVLGTGSRTGTDPLVSFEATKKAICWPFVKPSDGLEPSTPSLPCPPKRLPWVVTGCRSAYLSRFSRPPICDRLPPVAPARLFLKKGRLSSSRLVDRTSSDAPGRLDAHLFLGVGRTPCRWELSRL